MRRITLILLLVVLITGCTPGKDEMDEAIALRQRLLSSNGCSFKAVVTADYGDRIYTFSMLCQCDAGGNLNFEVLEPESISGIKGKVTEQDAQLTFDEHILLFEKIADGQITPVSAPWLLIHTIRSGYIKACGTEESGLHIQIDDSYAENALQMDVWLDEAASPMRAEILWSGVRIMTIDVMDFAFV